MLLTPRYPMPDTCPTSYEHVPWHCLILLLPAYQSSQLLAQPETLGPWPPPPLHLVSYLSFTLDTKASHLSSHLLLTGFLHPPLSALSPGAEASF